jgi:Flp pilus assembly pilin Flp
MFERITLKLGQAFLALKNEEDGQGATEYAMVIGFLVVGLTIGLGVLGVGIDNFLDRVAAELDLLVP